MIINEPVHETLACADPEGSKFDNVPLFLVDEGIEDSNTTINGPGR